MSMPARPVPSGPRTPRRPGRLIMIAAVLAGALLLGYALLRNLPWVPQIRSEVLLTEIRSVAKLTTIEIHATALADKRENNWLGARTMFVVVPGRAAVGVDLSDLTPESVEVGAETVRITLPRAKVLYVEIDMERVEEFSVAGWLRPKFTPQETSQLTAEAQKKIRAQAEDPEVLRRAEEQAAAVVRRIAEAAGARNVEVEIR